ncbi:MAG: BlaI family penicillinase repressor [Planctomycetota bacterium]|jgi:BlaI family penicillinase repressor
MPDDSQPGRLTDLELEIMDVIWGSHPTPATVRGVTDVLDASGRKPLAYTTVQTMMNILCRKGVLTSAPGPGRAHEYRALVTRESATTSMTQDFVQRLFGGRSKPLLAHLLEREELDRTDLMSLRELIDEQLTEED